MNFSLFDRLRAIRMAWTILFADWRLVHAAQLIGSEKANGFWSSKGLRVDPIATSNMIHIVRSFSERQRDHQDLKYKVTLLKSGPWRSQHPRSDLEENFIGRNRPKDDVNCPWWATVGKLPTVVANCRAALDDTIDKVIEGDA